MAPSKAGRPSREASIVRTVLQRYSSRDRLVMMIVECVAACAICWKQLRVVSESQRVSKAVESVMKPSGYLQWRVPSWPLPYVC